MELTYPMYGVTYPMYGTNLSYVWEEAKKSFIFNYLRLPKQNKELNKNNNRGLAALRPQNLLLFFENQKTKTRRQRSPWYHLTGKG